MLHLLILSRWNQVKWAGNGGCCWWFEHLTIMPWLMSSASGCPTSCPRNVVTLMKLNESQTWCGSKLRKCIWKIVQSLHVFMTWMTNIYLVLFVHVGSLGCAAWLHLVDFSLRIDQALDEELVPWLGMERPTCCLEIFGWMLVDDIFGNIRMNGYLTWIYYILYLNIIKYPYVSNEQIHHQFFLGWWLL